MKHRRPSFSQMQNIVRRAVLYVRYSSEMQRDGWSAEAQLADLRRYCEAHGWQIVAEFIDEAKSAKTDQRPEFQQALATIRDGRATIMVVHKLDRFSRNMEDTFRLVNEFDARGAGLVCTQQGIDTTNPISGKIVLAVLAALAEAYLDNLSEETAKGKRARVEAGLPNGDLTYGYANPDAGTEASGAGINNATIPVVVPARAAVVRQAFAQYATGQQSHARIAQALNNAGHRMVSKKHPEGYPWTKDTVTALLGNRFYLGQVRYGDVWLPGKHEAIIDQEVFDAVQAVHARKAGSGRRGSTTPDGRVYVAQGLVRCACCRQPLRANAPNGTALTYRDASRERGLVCTAARRTIDGATVDDAFCALVGALALPDDWRELALAASDGDQDEARRIMDRRQALDRQLEQAQRYLLDGFITEEQFLEKRAAVEAERATLEPPADSVDLDAAAGLLGDLGALWNAGSAEERRAMARALFDNVWVDLDGRRVVAVQMKNALRPLRRALSTHMIPDAGLRRSDTYGRMRNRRGSNPPLRSHTHEEIARWSITKPRTMATLRARPSRSAPTPVHPSGATGVTRILRKTTVSSSW